VSDRWALELRRVLERSPELRAVLAEILDRRERDGRLPARATLKVPEACVAALREILSTRAVVPAREGKVRLDLALAERALTGQGGPSLDALLYAALGRSPRDPRAEEATLRTELGLALGALAGGAGTTAARAFLSEEQSAAGRGEGEILALARQTGLADAVAECGRLVQLVDAVLYNEGPIRLANFAARVAGSSKALGLGGDRYRRLATILLRHHPSTLSEVRYDGEPRSEREELRLALEVHGIYRDEAALSVLCFGPLVYKKDGERFDHVARHATRGECVRLTLQQLRRASVADLPVRCVTLIENQTPFLDYVDALSASGRSGAELVVLSEGQARWAVVTLLKLLARRGVRFRHAGDLDRSGVLILRSLARRARVEIEPLYMDAATHMRFRARGAPLDPDEAGRLRALLAADDPAALGHELLAEIARTGLWIEQEAFSPETLVALAAGHDPAG
jgi:hypothetical protein